MFGRRLLLFVILSVGISEPVFAADYLAPGRSPADQRDWSGIYVGVIGGYSRGFASQEGIDVDFDSRNYTMRGGFIGGNAGFNYQFGQWVVGLDSELSYARITGSKVPYFSSTMSAIFTERARIGYSVGSVLTYIGLGPSYARLSNTETFPGATPISGSQIRSGWSFAAGADYMISPNLLARAEYTYLCFGSDIVRNTDVIKLMGHYAKLGLEFKMDVPGLKREEVSREQTPGEHEHNWSGIYLGPSIGGTAVSQRSSFAVNNVPVGTITGSSAGGIVGFGLQGTIGAQAGANWQMGQYLVGVESDFHLSELTGASTKSTIFVPSAGVPARLTQSTTIGEQGTVRARFGVVLDRWLIYGTAGLAYASYESDLDFFTAAGKTSSEFERTRLGAVAGAGVERAVWDKWTTRIEYMYADFGKSSYTVNAPAPFNSVTSKTNVSEHILRVAFNRFFN